MRLPATIPAIFKGEVHDIIKLVQPAQIPRHMINLGTFLQFIFSSIGISLANCG